MTTLAKNKVRATKAHERRLNIVPANAGEKFYDGGFILREAGTGVATKVIAAGNIPLGVLVEPLLPDPSVSLNCHLDNTSGADGTVNTDGTGDRVLRYDSVGEYSFLVHSGTPKVGDPAYLYDDDTVDTAAPATAIVVGRFTRPSPVGTGEWFVDLGKRASGVVALTDNSAGVANDTLEAIPNPADTPASADALRDDLVANTIPAIRNNFADLAAKVNALLARG